MNGRLENKIKTEHAIQDKITDMPKYMKEFYYSLGNKTHMTKMRYITNAIRFMNYMNNGECMDLTQLSEITDYEIQFYISQIKYCEDKDGEIKELKETTQCNIYSCLWAFFSFLYRKEYIKSNPFDKITERPKMKENEIVYLTPKEVKQVENNILNGTGSKVAVGRQKNWRYRDVLLFRIPVVNGLRVTALSEINIEDIDLAARKIKVIEKGNNPRTVDFDIKTAGYIREWLKQRKELIGDSKERAFFISNQRTRLNVRSIERIISKYSDCVEGKHITPHSLRRTCGTNSYKMTGDIHLVASILGHKSTSPTRRYAAIENQDRTDAINKVAYLY